MLVFIGTVTYEFGQHTLIKNSTIISSKSWSLHKSTNEHLCCSQQSYFYNSKQLHCFRFEHPSHVILHRLPPCQWQVIFLSILVNCHNRWREAFCYDSKIPEAPRSVQSIRHKKTLPGRSQLWTLLLKVKPEDKHNICLPSIMLDRVSFEFVAKSKASILCFKAKSDTKNFQDFPV